LVKVALGANNKEKSA